jgi:hypothetical protein
MPTPSLIIPGLYPGAGQAKLLHMNQQAYLLQNTRITATQASVAVQLERTPHVSYFFGAAIQVLFSGAPGAFEIDVEASEDDQDATYISIVTIVAVNALNAGRASVGFTYPKFIRARVVTLTNDVLTTLLVTR